MLEGVCLLVFLIHSWCRLLSLPYETGKNTTTQIQIQTQQQNHQRFKDSLGLARRSLARLGFGSFSLPSLLICDTTSTTSVSGSLSWSPSCFGTAACCFRYHSTKMVIIIVSLRRVEPFHFLSSPCKSKGLSEHRQAGRRASPNMLGAANEEGSKLFLYLSEIACGVAAGHHV